MNLGSLVTLAVIVLLVYICVRYLLENGLDSCSGDCSGCGPVCKWQRDLAKAQRQMRCQRKLKKTAECPICTQRSFL